MKRLRIKNAQLHMNSTKYNATNNPFASCTSKSQS